MKKTIIIITIIISIMCIYKHTKNEEEIIRFRIIANSNSETDQKLKKELVKDLSKTLINKNIKNAAEERNYLKEQLPTFERIINNKTNNYNINYGYNYFPKKTYNGKTYEEGNYESLVITIGKGEGDNFWCILFPPLCMIDEDNDIEYESFIKNALKKLH